MLRNRNLLTPTTLLPVFFKLFRTQDKRTIPLSFHCLCSNSADSLCACIELRELVFEHIVHDIKRMNLKHKNNTLNRTLQNFMSVPCVLVAFFFLRCRSDDDFSIL